MKQSLLTARGNILLPEFVPTLANQSANLNGDKCDSEYLHGIVYR